MNISEVQLQVLAMLGKNMSKITRITVSKNHGLELLRSINEASFLNKVADAVKAAANSFKGQSVPKEKEDPDRARPDSTTSADSKLAQIATEATSVTLGEARLVLHLSQKDLVGLYLKAGGGAALIDAMTDAEILSFTADPFAGKTRIVEMPENFTFAESIKSPANEFTRGSTSAVIIDAPKAMIAEIRAAGTDIVKARDILKRLMGHKYYVMTLDVSKAKAFETNVGTASDIDELKAVFNPNCLINYPIKQTKVAAMNEWNALQGEGKEETETAAIMRRGERAEKRREGEKKIAGIDGSQEHAILARITAAKSDDEAANVLKGMLSDTFTKDQLLTVLTKLNAGLKSERLSGLIAKLKV